jgi:periplasmic divalent cation tolerance protein
MKPVKASTVLVVMVTCPSRAVARRLATALIRRRLAACVNILPGVESVFTWEGKTERSREVLLLIKTPAKTFERLRRAVETLHPYDVPEVIALALKAGNRPYLAWVRRAVRS